MPKGSTKKSAVKKGKKKQSATEIVDPVQTDKIVENELGDLEELLCKEKSKLEKLNMEKRKNDIMEEIKKTSDGNMLNESEISRKEATVDAKYLRDLETMGKLDTPLVSAGLPHESVLADINPKDGKQKLKSGRIMTRSSTVVNDVQWPHMKVLPRLNVKGEIRFDDINHWE